MAKKRIKTFLSDGVTVKEYKVGILGTLTVISILFSLVMYAINKEISTNLLYLNAIVVTGFTGINVVDTITSKKYSRSNNINNSELGC